MLTINMLGKVNIQYNGKSIDDKLGKKLVALICLLVLNKNRDMSKEKIISYLWPDSTDDAAKYNLRFNLWTIKNTIPQDKSGKDFIIVGKDYCRINENYAFNCDIIALERIKYSKNLTISELIELKELFHGDFLEGLYLKNCNELNEMILFERVVCQNRQVEILTKLADLYEEQERYEEGLEILSEMAAIEPYNENFAYRIVSIYSKLGNRVSAINYYKNFEGTLRRNLNISPENKLKLLYGSLLESSGNKVNESQGNTGIRKKKIEVQGHCMKNVEYFLISDIINGIMKAADKKYMLELNKKYIFDLSFIQNDLILDYEKYISNEYEMTGFVPPVRIINAFYKFLLHAADIYDIHIKVINLDNIDEMSLNIMSHIKVLDPRITIN